MGFNNRPGIKDVKIFISGGIPNTLKSQKIDDNNYAIDIAYFSEGSFKFAIDNVSDNLLIKMQYSDNNEIVTINH